MPLTDNEGAKLRAVHRQTIKIPLINPRFPRANASRRSGRTRQRRDRDVLARPRLRVPWLPDCASNSRVGVHHLSEKTTAAACTMMFSLKSREATLISTRFCLCHPCPLSSL